MFAHWYGPFRYGKFGKNWHAKWKNSEHHSPDGVDNCGGKISPEIRVFVGKKMPKICLLSLNAVEWAEMPEKRGVQLSHPCACVHYKNIVANILGFRICFCWVLFTLLLFSVAARSPCLHYMSPAWVLRKNTCTNVIRSTSGARRREKTTRGNSNNNNDKK